MQVTAKQTVVVLTIVATTSYVSGYMSRKPQVVELHTQTQTTSHTVGAADRVTVTETKYVQVPGKAPQKESVKRTVAVNPKTEAKVEIKEERTQVTTNKQPSYRVGIFCRPIDCLDATKLGFTLGVPMGESPFTARVSFQPKSLATTIGIEVDF